MGTKKKISFFSVMQSHRVRLLRSYYEGIRIKKGEGDMERERDLLFFLPGSCEPYVPPWDTINNTRGSARAQRHTSTQTHGKQAANCVRGSGMWRKCAVTSTLSSDGNKEPS